MDDKFTPKNPQIFSCEKCTFISSSKKDYQKHLLTLKHSRMTNGLQMDDKPYFLCYCGRQYKHRQGLWKHQQNCVGENPKKNPTNVKLNELDKDELIINLLKQNADLIKGQQDMIIKLTENGFNSNNNNTINTNSHNKAFNLNLFLNETCKDAMNITEFIESIKLQLCDLEKVGELGYVEGISNIIVKNLNELDVTKRPVHCTDKKRETMYVKDKDRWEKDEQNVKLHKLVKKVTSQNQKLLTKFKEKYPDCLQYHSKYSDQYSKIVYESMGGKGDNDYEKEEKIIKNIVKEVVLDKNL